MLSWQAIPLDFRSHGTIGFTPGAITITLQASGEVRVARVLALLIDQINATQPQMPGDTRPIA